MDRVSRLASRVMSGGAVPAETPSTPEPHADELSYLIKQLAAPMQPGRRWQERPHAEAFRQLKAAGEAGLWAATTGLSHGVSVGTLPKAQGPPAPRRATPATA